MAQIRGVILDVDGTLIDSNDAHAHAWFQALQDNGCEISYDRVWHLVGMGGDHFIPEAAHVEKDSPQGQRISQRRLEIFNAHYRDHLQAQPGARELVQRLHDEGQHLIIASSAKSDELQSLLDVAQIADLVPEHTSSDDTEHSKPDPDVVQAALAKLGLPADQVVMIGDSPYDIQAARKAGVQTIALRCGGWSDADLHGATAVYNDPADLLNHYTTSVLSRGTD